MKKLGFSFLLAAGLALFASCDRSGDTQSQGQDTTHHDTLKGDSALIEGKVAGTLTFQGKPCKPGTKGYAVPPCDGPYPGFELTFSSANPQTPPKTAMTDSLGHFEIVLPPGEYFTLVQNGADPEKNKEKITFSVTSGQTTTLDLKIFTGIQ